MYNLNTVTTNFRHTFRYFFIILCVGSIFIAVIIYRNLSNNKNYIPIVKKADDNSFIIQVKSSVENDSYLIKEFSVNKLVDFTNEYYRFNLTGDDIKKLDSSSVKYTILPYAYSYNENLFGIYRAQISEPILESKIQELANYCTILKGLKNQTVQIMWCDSKAAEKVSLLGFVGNVRFYYLFEKLSFNLINKISDTGKNDKLNYKIELLIFNKDVDYIKNVFKQTNVEFLSELNRKFINNSIEVIDVKASSNQESLFSLLNKLPNIMYVEVE